MQGAGRRKRMASRGTATRQTLPQKRTRRALRFDAARPQGLSSYPGKRMIAGTRLSCSGIPPAAGILRALSAAIATPRRPRL